MNTKTLLAALATAGITASSVNAATITTLVSDDFESAANADGADSDAFTVDSPSRGGYSVAYEGDNAALLRGNSGMTLTNALSLATGGYTSIDISFRLKQYPFAEPTNAGSRYQLEDLEVYYSASGDFSDEIEIASYNGNGRTDSDYQLKTITLTDSATPDADPLTVNFTDTAKIRFVALDPESGDWSHVDNFQITAVPEPGSLALLGLGGLQIAARRRRA